MKTIAQHKALGTVPPTFAIVKKRGKYLTFVNGEIRYSEKQSEAIVFESPSHVQQFADSACIDTRNAGFLRGSQSVEISTGHQSKL